MFQNQIFMTFLSGISYMLAAGALSLILTKLCIWVLPMFGMVDIPHGRHQHAHAVPRGGGIAIILSFTAIAALYYLQAGDAGKDPLLLQLGPPVLVMFILGVIDDKIELPSLLKLCVQILVASYLFFTNAGISHLLRFELPIYISLPLTIVWACGVINAFNLIDGMDGIAAGLASIAAFALAVWFLISGTEANLLVLMLIFCGACLGFLRYNFSPASIFMGDTGSLFIGLFFAYFSMAESTKAMTVTTLLVPLLAMGIPIFDVFLAILRRLYRKYIKKEPGVGIMTGDHDHLHHRIQEQMQNPRKTAYLLYALATLLVTGAIAAALVSNLMQTLSFAVLLVILFIVIRFATIEFYDTAELIANGVKFPHRSFLLTALHPVIDCTLLTVAYLITSTVFQRNILISPYSLQQALCYIAPFPLILAFSGVYRTYWLRAGIKSYYKLLLMLFFAAVIVLAISLGLILWNFGVNRDQISLMREFYTAYIFMGSSFIFMERFVIHYMESYSFRSLEEIVGKEKLTRTVIYGGGLYCRMFLLSQTCVANEPVNRKIIGIIDDNPSLRGLNVYGLDVLGTTRDLAKLKEKYQFDEIIIALRLITDEKRKKLIDFGKRSGILVEEFQCYLKQIPAENSELTDEEKIS